MEDNMPLIVMPQSAKDRVTGTSLAPFFPGQSVLTGYTGGQTVVTRLRSWSGTLSVAQVEPRVDPEAAAEITGFMSLWADPSNYALLPLNADTVPVRNPTLPGVVLGRVTINPDGTRTYAVDPFGLVPGQLGVVGDKLVMIGEVDTAGNTISLLPNPTLNQGTRIQPRAEVLARAGAGSGRSARVETNYGITQRGPWSISWVEVVGT